MHPGMCNNWKLIHKVNNRCTAFRHASETRLTSLVNSQGWAYQTEGELRSQAETLPLTSRKNSDAITFSGSSLLTLAFFFFLTMVGFGSLKSHFCQNIFSGDRSGIGITDQTLALVSFFARLCIHLVGMVVWRWFGRLGKYQGHQAEFLRNFFPTKGRYRNFLLPL